MPTNYNSNITSTNIPSKRGSSIPRVISDVVDFSSTTNATGDTFDVLPIPAAPSAPIFSVVVLISSPSI